MDCYAADRWMVSRAAPFAHGKILGRAGLCSVLVLFLAMLTHWAHRQKLSCSFVPWQIFEISEKD